MILTGFTQRIFLSCSWSHSDSTYLDLDSGQHAELGCAVPLLETSIAQQS